MRWSGSKRTILPDEGVVFDQAKADAGKYTKSQLEAFANQMLKEQAREIDPETGKKRGVRGEDSILFPEHEHARRKKELYAVTGMVDPNIEAGIYFRAHPQGRKINSAERRAQGAGWFSS